MKIKAILFDLEETLYNHGVARKRTLEILARKFSKKIGVEPNNLISAYLEVSSRLMESDMSEPSIFDKNRVFTDVLLYLKRDPDKILVKRLAKEYWIRILGETKPYLDVKPTLSTLKNLGYKLAIVSDGFIETQTMRLNALRLKDFFDVCAFSEEVGINKPNVEVFRLALKKLNIKQEEAVMIGDNVSRDVLGAKKLGIKTIWVRRGLYCQQMPQNLDETPDYIIDNFQEILKILETL